MKYELCTDYGMIFRRIVEHTCAYIDKNDIKTLVLGMSGGIDSTLTAALAREVVDKCTVKVELKGLVLPIQSDKIEMERAVTASKAFCDSYEYKDMTAAYMALAANVVSAKFGGHDVAIRCGNIKARMRMIKLYDIAQKMNGMVLSTDNYTEYLLGFWTLHGDVGDYGMIQNLWKTEVYGLANYLLDKHKKNDELYKAIALLEGINAMPTDGLGISKSDFDQIYPYYDKNSTPVDVYRSIDVLLLNYLNDVHLCPDNGVVIKRHKATRFKRSNPFIISRTSIIG